ncbi:class I SAM-dependent methyltransferase [Dyadobacter chenwenxiniae]|uniref:Class I SAM-dependent methyltransferase n=1 Tax=Dyadobacter chenwenxiniae TaxID=2906456 RepID=A0A9X1PHG4_9BACT|nr:class I SAM-dependent methyltransferase [Dyadobacter chenwenxiniae]MCF0060335.1 class I SAM-dependent methyltransferase [Dyadobacter chenwenxiniae]UON86068.1 class I SAM-dependent methyltransferase [Dyadobacter chenwenxiniae]
MSIDNTQKAYDKWSEQYDTNVNKTRDLEAVALRQILTDQFFESILEIGCGTGKNSQWLITRAKKLVGADLSAEMLGIAREKLSGTEATFIQADITQEWNFTQENFELITFSLVLEHIENLDFIFSEVSKKLTPDGKVYLGELHPFKQYSGSKARFETDEGQTVVPCYIHNVSDFTEAALKYGLKVEEIHEFFDDNDRTKIPRILALVFGKG